MGDALGDLAIGHHVDDLGGVFAASVDERELRGDGSLAALDVGGRRFVKLTQAVDRVVKLRYDVAETRLGQIGEIVLELGESSGRKFGLGRVSDEIDRLVTLEKRIKAPRVFVTDDLKRFDALGLQVFGHAQHVGLERVGRKDVGVDALEDVPYAARRLHLERVVDVSRAVARNVGLVGDAHGGEHRREFFLRIVAVGHYFLFFPLPLPMTGICAAATDWPRRRAFSSGMKMSIFSAHSG